MESFHINHSLGVLSCMETGDASPVAEYQTLAVCPQGCLLASTDWPLETFCGCAVQVDTLQLWCVWPPARPSCLWGQSHGLQLKDTHPNLLSRIARQQGGLQEWCMPPYIS